MRAHEERFMFHPSPAFTTLPLAGKEAKWVKQSDGQSGKTRFA
jgi:hypothetical protein